MGGQNASMKSQEMMAFVRIGEVEWRFCRFA